MATLNGIRVPDRLLSFQQYAYDAREGLYLRRPSILYGTCSELLLIPDTRNGSGF